MLYTQVTIFESGNELAALAAKQINYHIMGYFPITPSTQIAEHLDFLGSEGEHNICLIPADGEHGAAGVCYGASVGGGRVFNATSANGLLYSLEQLPVQSGTRSPMVLNVACRTVSGPLSIKGDHSDIMYALNTGWVILFAKDPQGVYDMNIAALKLAEILRLPVIVAFDGFFTSHQKRLAKVFLNDNDVQEFLGSYTPEFSALDMEHPVTIGAYMNEPDVLNNKYQLHLAMEEARTAIPEVFGKLREATGREYDVVKGYRLEDADVILVILGSSYDTAIMSVDKLRAEGRKVGVATLGVLRPFPAEELAKCLKNARAIVVADRQDSYGAGGGNLTLELKASLQSAGLVMPVISRVYGLSGRDFYVDDGVSMLSAGLASLGAPNNPSAPKRFDYYGHYPGTAGSAGSKNSNSDTAQFFNPISLEEASPGITKAVFNETTGKMEVVGGGVKETTAMPKRWTAGHGACPGCGIPINVNLLLRAIEGHVVLLFHTGCGMVVTTSYPKTAFRVPYVHNLFQNGAATLSGLVEMFHQRQLRGEIPKEDITFVMVSGDGGMDIGMGPTIGTALRNHRMIVFEYDNGGYMNTGYQLSYSTPMGSRSSTSHVGPASGGKAGFHKDTPQIMAATNIPYIATVSEHNPADFIRKAAKAGEYARRYGMVYLKSLSACPLNWGDNPADERAVIEAAVNSCYHPLYEIENGITHINYDPEAKNKKIPISDWFKMMGRTKHLTRTEYAETLASIQAEVDRRWAKLKAKHENPLL